MTSLGINIGAAVLASAKVPVFSTVVSANQNTTTTNNMGSDGYTWANAPAVVDGHGNIIAITEDNSQGHHFTYLNASGSTWTDASLSEAALVRGAMWLDTAHNLLHVLWYSTALPGVGTLYRRYVVTYSGNNITDIVSDSTIGTRTNVVLENGSGIIKDEHPVLLAMPDIGGTYGALLAIWGSISATGGEIRATMCVMGATATAGQTLANWVAPVSASTTTLGANTAPLVGSYSALYTTNNHAEPLYFGIARHANGTHAKDLFLCHADGAADASATYSWRRATWNAGASNWSTGLTADTTIYAVQRAGSNTGYDEKAQLITAPSEDASGNMFVGLASWKDNANGDTWGFAKVSTNGTITTVDIHSWAGSSAGGTPQLYPTGDVMVDPVNGYIVTSYITQTDAKIQLYTPGLAVSGSAVQVFSVVSDIPLLLRSRVGGGTKLGVLERDAINTPTPPYHGKYSTVLWG